MTYNLKRAADRTRLADALAAVATAEGATETERRYRERSISLTFELDSAAAHIRIDGGSSLDVPLVNWVAPRRPGCCFSGAFVVDAGGDICRAQPHHKETTCPRDCDALLERLADGFACVAAGDAFQFHISEMAARTAYHANGSPGDKAAWIAEYRRTGVAPSVSPEIAARRAAFDAAGGMANYAEASEAAAQAWTA